MLDTVCGFGTLAERTSKQPGMPGTQQEAGGIAANAPNPQP